MAIINFPYGKEKMTADIPDKRLNGILVSELHSFKAEKNGIELVKEALANPIKSLPLHELAKGKNNIVIIASDHTRPVPSKAIIPPMLEEIRKALPKG